MKVVLDTNVLVSGLMYRQSTPGRIVQASPESRIELVMSREQLAEIARMLTYPKISRILNWPRPTVERFLKQIYLRSVMVELRNGRSVDVPRDPNDSAILSSLLAGRADCLVTGDADLLALRERYPVLTPKEFLARL